MHLSATYFVYKNVHASFSYILCLNARGLSHATEKKVPSICRRSYTLVETFSLLAVGTSLIGTLLGASQFFIEQMTILASPAAQGHVCST
jgi:hypothetical protein